MKKTKIILVDDQPSYRNVVKTVLKTVGDVEIIGEASNGAEFIDLLKQKMPDVVFMDVEMPVMDGIEATRRSLKLYPGLVIIGLSLYENQNYIDELLKAGARGYLLKMSDNYKLFETILKFPKAEIFFSEKIKPKTKMTNINKKTILVVDDFESNTFVIGFSLENAGFQVVKAENGEQALQKAKSNKIDLMITDYVMPGMQGPELIKKIREIHQYSRLPVLVLSSEKDEAKKRAAFAIGITGWIQKPFQLPAFLKIVEKALQS
jgi:DNA-binding NarL/FixJ family response regulator